MKIALKNFLTTLRRYKTASALNIAGLTLAFVSLYVLAAQLIYGFTYNRSLKDSDRMYMICPVWSGGMNAGMIETVSRYSTERAAAECADVEAIGAIGVQYFPDGHVWVRRAGDELERFEGTVEDVSLSLLDVFSLRIVAGEAGELERPGTVMVSRSEARRLGVGLGDVLMLAEFKWGEDERPTVPVEIVGIYEDFAPNSVASRLRIIRNLGDKDLSFKEDGNFSYMYFAKLHEGADPSRMESRLSAVNAATDKARADYYGYLQSEDGDMQKYRLLPVGEVYFETSFEDPSPDMHGSAGAMLTMLGVAVLIAVMAFINFVNFFFALIPVHLRSVNVCKVFGASTSSLRSSFVFEAVGLVLCSLVAGVYLIFALGDAVPRGWTACSLAVGDNLAALAVVCAAGVAMAVAAALYPAWYITSFNASLAAKGGYAGSAAGRRLRMLLIGVQFVISATLIVVTVFFAMQYRYMVRFDLGFDKENLLALETSHAVAERSAAFVSRLEEHPGIKAVTTSYLPFFAENGIAVSTFIDEQPLTLTTRYVGKNFFEVMGIGLVEGTGFLAEPNKDMSAFDNEVVINCYGQRKYGLQIGDRFADLGPVVGVVEDAVVRPVASGPETVAYMTAMKRSLYNTFYVRTEPMADIGSVAAYIRKVAREIDPLSDEVDVELFDSVVRREYEDVKRSMSVIGAFALVAVAISLMGVFGVVLFETQHRRREIAVRKVFGSTTSELLWMLGRRYAVIVAVCFAVAAPLAWWIVREWINGFAHRIAISWWVFVAVFVVLMALTLALVTLRSLRAARENPAHVLGKD